jgi:hypothetical protein
MTDLTVANTIIRQLGGEKRLTLMVGATQFLGSEDRIQFRFKGSHQVNTCVVTLDWSDTYTFQLWKITKAGMSKKFEVSGLYFDMLVSTFEQETGLYLSL